jgi:hypothetical protein
VLAEQDNRAPSALGGAAIGRQCDDRLQLRVLAQLFRQQPAPAIADSVQQSADRLLADVNAAQRVLGRRVVSQQVDDVVPVRLVDVVAMLRCRRSIS